MKKGVLYLVLVILISSLVVSAPAAPGTPGSSPEGPSSIGGGPTGPSSIGGPTGPGSIGGPGTPGLPGTTTNTCFSGDGVCVSGCYPTDTDCFMTPGCFDFDGDTFGLGCTAGLDCNDNNNLINPLVTEVCGDTIDNNCNGVVDEGCGASCTDLDGDTFGVACTAGADCNDADALINPLATEICDTVDNNCDGSVDEGGVCGPAVCGDGITQDPNDVGFSEECDDGNTIDTDACSNSCTFTTPTCSLITADWGVTTAVEGDVVSLSVESSSCVGETLSFEVFEDDLAGDEAAAINPIDVLVPVGGIVPNTWTAEWQCDGGVAGICLLGNPEYYFIAKVVSDPTIEITSGLLTTTASSAVCGNGIIEAPETCDDSNTVAGDGCSDICMIEGPPMPVCGDGVIEPPETCDDSNTVAGDGCSDVCMIEGCIDLDGDGHGVGCAGGLDCDDTNPTTFFGAPEICTDLIDNNCVDGINEISICSGSSGGGGNTGGGGGGGGSSSANSGYANSGYPGFCYNGRKDIKEDGLDCGGLCVKKCSTAVVPQETSGQNIVPTIPKIGTPPVSQEEDKSIVPVLIGGLLLLGGLGGVAYYFVHKHVVSGAVGAARTGNAYEVAKRYVKNYMKLGYNQKDISAQMLKSGWKQKDIDNVFSQASK